MTATEFLNQLKELNLTTREFLALIGHTNMSNADYTEIKANPDMPRSRLVVILENAPIEPDDYIGLLKTAHYRKAKDKQKAEAEASTQSESEATPQPKPLPPKTITITRPVPPNQLVDSDKLSATVTTVSFNVPTPVPVTVPISEYTEEISIVLDDDDEDLLPIIETRSAPTVEELWGDEPESLFEEIANIGFDEYGGNEDFDKDARKENTAKIIICLVCGVVLMFGSFFMRYLTTGHWDLSGLGYKPPQSYAELHEMQSKQTAKGRVPLSESRTLPSVAGTDSFLFKLVGDNIVRAVEISSGKFKSAPSFVPNAEIAEMFLLNNKLYVICKGETLAELVDGVDENLSRVKIPQTAVFKFDAIDYTGEWSNHYVIDGEFRECILTNEGFLIVTDYKPIGTSNPEHIGRYVPSYSVNDAVTYVELEDMQFIRGSSYYDMTLIASFLTLGEGLGVSVSAVVGNLAESVYYSSYDNVNSLIMSFFADRDNQSHIVRYAMTAGLPNNASAAWVTVDGMVGGNRIDERAGVVSVVAELSGPALYLFQSNRAGLTYLSQIRNIAVGSVAESVIFDNGAVYITVGGTGLLYAVDTSDTSNPEFMTEVYSESLVPNNRRHYWGGTHFFTVDVDDGDAAIADIRNVNITMYAVTNKGAIHAVHTYRLPLNDAVFHEYTDSPARDKQEAVAVSVDAGVIVIPVTYFNAVSRVECFFVLSYCHDAGFGEVGRIIEIGSNTREHAVLIRGGYIYTFWDSTVRSAATDSTIIALHELDKGGL